MSSIAARESLYKRISEADFRFVVLFPFITTSVHLFLYGLNVLLFWVGLGVLRRREQKKNVGNRLLRVALVSLFLLCSVSVPLSLVSVILDVKHAFCLALAGECSRESRLPKTVNIMHICILVILMIMTCIVDAILVFRSFVICGWQRKSYALALVTFCILFDGGSTAIRSRKMQLLHSPSEAATLNPTSSDSYFEILTFLDYVSLGFVLIHLLINGFLTSVIARKILLSRARQGLASTTGDRFRTLAILLVESFLLYLIGWAVFAACILSRLRNFM
ncbi:hypothetical protein AAF712_011753, partial [Marasmius tenuissimus]